MSIIIKIKLKLLNKTSDCLIMKNEKHNVDFYPREECTKEESAFPCETPCLLSQETKRDFSSFDDPAAFKEKVLSRGIGSLSEGEILYAVFLSATENDTTIANFLR